jgi:hypothetical protein
MSSENIYSYVIGSSWIFLAGWIVAILYASAIAFRRDLS